MPMADISMIREGVPMSFSRQLRLTVTLATPAMLAQLSSITMQYIDASMVGRLGADASASIGLVSTTLWLFWGICSAVTTGFSVQVAHKVGAKDFKSARDVLRQGLIAALLFSFAVSAVGIAISAELPRWLGGNEEISPLSSLYFLVFVSALPLLTISYLAGGMLRCVGNIKVPSLLSVLMCVLDCMFNFLLIFPSRDINIAGMDIHMPGAGLGVLGAALGTVLAEAVTAALMLWYVYCRQPELRLKGIHGSYRPQKAIIRKAATISAPMTLEHAVICGAQIAVTTIVAPLGVIAIAANSFAVTAESLCYMPGYGIGDAATTLVGQSYGAGRMDLVRRFAYITVGLGMAVMSVMGIAMWIASPLIMEMMTPVKEISELGIEILRIEAWAEPMFAAAIVTYGVFIGVGSTTLPAVMNFASIWIVRLPLAWILARTMGLRGVWIAMCLELIFRGSIFLIRLWRRRWIPSLDKNHH
ncbi:MAG: MATE family efflux transporter [Muribaculaceae bacterium]|nr:MATE family efflux transporter [Muribaculaceae bacterium]MDE6344143.1 MATE family efflux transporter [Muribaculaceae bacterium]MDE6610848.1 MATE family efflux transporter [Muribaculaceae bacterium]